MLTCAHEPRPAASGGDTDTLSITAVSADHPQEVAWAQEARANGTRGVTSGIIDNVLTQMLLSQMTDEMCRRGAVQYFYMGLYRLGGREYNTVMKSHFDAPGY